MSMKVPGVENELVEGFDPRLVGPFTMLMAGPTSCGKTHLVSQLLHNVNELVTPLVKQITYCYGQWQPLYEAMPDTVTFHKGLPSRETLLESKRDVSEHTLLVVDDLLAPEDSELVKDLFIKGSHHRNMSVVFLTQNLFLRDKNFRTLSINAHYLVIFKNPRDMSQIQALSRQVFPNRPKFLTNVYNKETSASHAYLLLDFKQSTPDRFRVRSSITTPWNSLVFSPV